ncbi:MAG: class I SAM-dependent methyltransferase [Candidatus Margulisbacteria bacterium]|jgi:SAM-dependent methyltransferase|nr:class I SAM-dependent methyltransferase [Candidatus Margulisiibacteriota bacterium]
MSDNINLDQDSYRKYLDNWLDGISSEISFWKSLMVVEHAGGGGVTYIKKKFILEKYITGKKTRLLDVGSGPFPYVGAKTDKTELEYHAVDPLAQCYKILRDRYKICADIIPEFAFVEYLTEKFSENYFDIVHMSNALDHCFNPLLGIYQMLHVCRIGGKVILRHGNNEAENSNYDGFHQWNICVENTELIIWRPKIRYNITQIIQKYADIFLETNEPSQHGVILQKKQTIPLEKIQFLPMSIVNEKIFERLYKLIFRMVDKKRNNVYIWIRYLLFKIPLVVILSKNIKKMQNLRKIKE